MDAARDVDQIEVRQLRRRRQAVHHVARAQERHVERLAVVRDDHRGVGEALGEAAQDGLLLAEAAQEELLA